MRQESRRSTPLRTSGRGALDREAPLRGRGRPGQPPGSLEVDLTAARLRAHRPGMMADGPVVLAQESLELTPMIAAGEEGGAVETPADARSASGPARRRRTRQSAGRAARARGILALHHRGVRPHVCTPEDQPNRHQPRVLRAAATATWPKLIPPSFGGRRSGTRTAQAMAAEEMRGSLQQEAVLEHAPRQDDDPGAMLRGQIRTGGGGRGGDGVVEVGGAAGGRPRRRQDLRREHELPGPGRVRRRQTGSP